MDTVLYFLDENALFQEEFWANQDITFDSLLMVRLSWGSSAEVRAACVRLKSRLLPVDCTTLHDHNNLSVTMAHYDDLPFVSRAV